MKKQVVCCSDDLIRIGFVETKRTFGMTIQSCFENEVQGTNGKII